MIYFPKFRRSHACLHSQAGNRVPIKLLNSLRIQRERAGK